MGLILERVKYNKHRLIVKQVFHKKGINIWKIMLNYISLKTYINMIKTYDNALSRKYD